MSWTWAINDIKAWKEDCSFCHGTWPREQVKRLEDGRYICEECEAWLNLPIEDVVEEIDENSDL